MKDDLSSRSTNLKACQLPKHCTAVYHTTRKDLITLESYHSDRHFIMRFNNHKLNSMMNLFILQSNLPTRNVQMMMLCCKS